MAIVWTSELSVGVNQIDSQHKLLFAKADELFEAGKAGKTKDYLAEILFSLLMLIRCLLTG